jgi:hypothetical protein
VWEAEVAMMLSRGAVQMGCVRGWSCDDAVTWRRADASSKFLGNVGTVCQTTRRHILEEINRGRMCGHTDQYIVLCFKRQTCFQQYGVFLVTCYQGMLWPIFPSIPDVLLPRIHCPLFFVRNWCLSLLICLLS